MKPIVKTLAMAVFACVACGLAWYYYPKIEVVETNNREQLLTEDEVFEQRDVRRVRIEQFDRTTNAPGTLEIVLEGGSWVIPGKAGFAAGNAERVASVVNSMIGKDILEMVSDQNDDHEKYNVLELSESGSTGLGVGTLITYEGRNRKPLGKLIVGETASQTNLRYVRLAGQPQIYVVDFNDTVLTTSLTDWTDGDLLRFGEEPPNLAELIEYIDVDLYFVDAAGLRADGEKKHVYRARIKVVNNRWVYDLWQPDEDQKLSEKPTLVNQNINLEQTLGPFVNQLRFFAINDVLRKQAEVAINLIEPGDSQPASDFESLIARGFRQSGFETGQHLFDSAAGDINLVYRYGMKTKIYLGSLAGMDISGGGKIKRHLMLTAQVDPSIIPEPTEPAEDADDDSKRRYAAEVARKKQLIELAEQQARALNQFHADWVYIVAEDVISNLFPPVDAWKK